MAVFLEHCNGIDNGVVNKLPKFADDIKLVGIVSSEYEVEQLHSDLQRLYDLSLDWQKKYKSLFITWGNCQSRG